MYNSLYSHICMYRSMSVIEPRLIEIPEREILRRSTSPPEQSVHSVPIFSSSAQRTFSFYALRSHLVCNRALRIVPGPKPVDASTTEL